MSQRRGTAVVCGASMAGLLAASVLSDFYGSVTVVERDMLPELAVQRKGVSQGRHLHALLTRGSVVLAQLLPGLLEDLLASGAKVVDGTDPSVISARVFGHELSRRGVFADPDALVTYLASRPLLEACVRRRVRAMPNVAFLEGHDVVESILGSAGRVVGVRAVDRSNNRKCQLNADLVVDATGRSARTPAFLESHGYGRPPEQTYAVDLTYSTQFFRVPSGALAEKMVITGPTLERSTGAGVLAYEDDTVCLTLMGMAGCRPPPDLSDMLALADVLLPSTTVAALRLSEPLGGVAAAHYPTSVWRRYDKMKRFPDGFIVIGDAVCSFNPVYGQGMTSAALQAKALRDWLADSHSGDLSSRYFRGAAATLDRIWKANRVIDFAIRPVEGWRVGPQRLMNVCLEQVVSAAADDTALTEAFLRTQAMTDSPLRLLRPSMLMRVIRSRRRGMPGT